MLRVLKQFILTTLFAVSASQASAMFIQPDWFDPTQPGVGTNRYAYSFNDPVNNLDPNGNACGAAYGNFASGYCQRANIYQSWDQQISQSHNSRMFGAMSLTVQLYGSTRAGFGLGSLFDGMTIQQEMVMEGISESIFSHNVGNLERIQNGSINLTGSELSSYLLSSEQGHLQSILDRIQTDNPDFYGSLVDTMNASLNATDSRLQNLLPEDRLYMSIVESARTQLGRNIDFSSQSDRIMIGNALLEYVEDGGALDLYWYHDED